MATGAIWTRWCFVIKPRNIFLASVNFLLFTVYNVVGAVVWGCGITLLGYWLGQFEIIQKLIEPIFILIVLVSIVPIFWEYYKRRRAEKANAAAAGVPEAAEPELPRD